MSDWVRSAFAAFLEAAGDVQAFYKSSEATGFTIECQAAGGGTVRDYDPDFIARDTGGMIWIIETKGREDLNDPRKWERLTRTGSTGNRGWRPAPERTAPHASCKRHHLFLRRCALKVERTRNLRNNLAVLTASVRHCPLDNRAYMGPVPDAEVAHVRKHRERCAPAAWKTPATK